MNDLAPLPSDITIHPLASAVFGLAAAAFGAGMVQYLLPASACSRHLLAWATLPPLLLPLAAILGIHLTRPWGHLPYAVGIAAIIRAAVHATRREPSAQHEWLIAGLLSMPGFVVVVSVLGVDSFYPLACRSSPRGQSRMTLCRFSNAGSSRSSIPGNPMHKKALPALHR